ncbi:unnamed protein product [Dibothriocephalus latus]|uniref:Uncharacterized protein n=1 Tax=Dibothriocephalus latus TaxID=60516 RepID=A0A3P7M286_DIBLA|nr:unnamed protein product [Dibothriocephalus latus]
MTNQPYFSSPHPQELASQPKTSDCGIGGENKQPCLTPSTPGRLSVSTVAQSPKPPASIVAVNASRIAQLRSNAHGIAEVFLATDEMAEQNAIILKNLVASTAFTSRPTATVELRRVLSPPTRELGVHDSSLAFPYFLVDRASGVVIIRKSWAVRRIRNRR